jgi:hypothetical protein
MVSRKSVIKNKPDGARLLPLSASAATGGWLVRELADCVGYAALYRRAVVIDY